MIADVLQELKPQLGSWIVPRCSTWLNNMDMVTIYDMCVVVMEWMSGYGLAVERIETAQALISGLVLNIGTCHDADNSNMKRNDPSIVVC